MLVSWYRVASLGGPTSSASFWSGGLGETQASVLSPTATGRWDMKHKVEYKIKGMPAAHI